jgi:hypothetical protein
MKYQNVVKEEVKEIKIRRKCKTDQRVYLKTLKL